MQNDISKLKTPIILSLVIIFTIPQIVSAAISLPWSTTFNCFEWTSPNTNTCDGLNRGGDFPCTDGTGSHYTQITSGANMAAGGGGRGFRNWYGPCKNINSGGVDAYFSYQKELWIRWYMRFPTNFGWGCGMIAPKLLYFNLPSKNQFQPYLWGWDGVRFYCYSGGEYTPTPNTGVGWDTIMKNGANDPLNPGHKLGDGLWHYYEVHVKAPTSPTAHDGILQMWIDGRLVMDFNTAFWTDDTGWNYILFNANYEGPMNDNTCKAVDMDDIAISTTGYIGPIGDSTPDTTAPAAPTGLAVI